MRRGGLFVLAIALAVRGGILFAQSGNPGVPQWPDDFEYLGSTVLQSAPYPNDAYGQAVGDWKWGKALAVRIEPDGSVGLYAGSWNPQAVLEWRVTPGADGHFSGNASFVRSLGTGLPVNGELIGLYWDREEDQDVLLGSSNNTYDGDLATNPTFSRAVIDPSTGLLVSRNQFRFANRSDKMTQGGIAAVPDWWRTKYTDCGRLLAGWGGYWSVVATGPASMGPAMTCFTPPTPLAGADTSVFMPNQPLIGFPFNSSTTSQTPATVRMDIDYTQVLHWGWWPESVQSPPGWWAPGDQIWQGCTWVDTPAVSGLVCVPTLLEGCVWYGDNNVPQSLPYTSTGELCSPTPGKAAAINSQRAAHWVFTYDPADLGEVALGLRSQTSVQPAAEVRVQFPGISYPLTGMPSLPRMITGVAFEPTRHLLAVMVRNNTDSNGRPTIFWYHVRDIASNPAPSVTITLPSSATTITQDALQAFAAKASDSAGADLSSSVAWKSSLDGPLATGAAFSTSSLSVGLHQITASVADSGGVTATAAVSLTVVPRQIATGIGNELQFAATPGGGFFGYNKTTGAWLSKAFNGTPFANVGSGALLTGWQILPARFNTDGLSDLFFYNPSTGAWRKALGAARGFSIYMPPAMETGWTPLVLDLNGDGLSDVLFYNSTTGAWKRGISTAGPTNFTYATGAWAPGWHIFKANFNADGRDDVFLYNTMTGAWAKAITQPDLSFTIVPGDTTWEVGWQITPGDFDGDHITDLFTYRESDGHAMRVTFTDSSATYTTATLDPGWTVRAGDLNGDGKTDLLLYNPTTGDWGAETSTGTWFTNYVGPSAAGSGWDLRTTYLDSDGAADVLWYLPATGQTRVWLMQDAAAHTEIAGPTIAKGLSLVTDVPWSVTNTGGMPYPIPVCGTTPSPSASTASGFGGTGQISISAGLPTCGWTAVSNAGWLNVLPASGIAPSGVTWTADPNTTGASRQATVTIAGQAITITQKPQSNPMQLDGSSGGDFVTYQSSTGQYTARLYDGSPYTTGSSKTLLKGWQFYPARFNTDGLTDFFLYNPANGQYRKAINAGSGALSIYFPPSALAAGYTVTLGDFNGDGITDVFLYNPTTGAWKRGIGSAGLTNFKFTTGTWAPGWQVFRADFNNDTRDDLFVYCPSGTNAGQWQRILTNADLSFTTIPGDTTWEPNWSVFPGDFDGNGITDLFLYRTSDGHAQRVTFTTNSATYQNAVWGTGLTIRMGDLSADGKTDVLAYNSADGSWSTAVANGAGWFNVYNSLPAQNIGPGWVPYVEYIDTDIRADVLWYEPGTGETMEWITVSPSTFTTITGPTLATGLSIVADPQ